MHHLHIFLSSPGDVSRERQLAQEVIDRIQSERAYRDRLKLEVVAWDKPGAGTAMPAQMEPQEAIDRELKKPSECDIVIVIFWARMGTLLSDKYLKPDGSRYRYPQGASPVAAFDMSGNVEEWCLNERDKPHRIKETGEARRAVRGGSWINFHDHALYAYRFNYNPRNRSINLGFRLLCSSPLILTEEQ